MAEEIAVCSFGVERNLAMDISRRNLFLTSVGLAACGAVETFASDPAQTETEQEREGKMFFKLYPVGRVEKKGGSVRLRILDKYAGALQGLNGFSHLFVLYWFDRNDTPRKRGVLQVHPRGNRENPLTGVFACRAPVRPNLIALSLCKILSVKEAVVRIDKIDAFDGSPILDIKPYIPQLDSAAKDVRLPDWLRR